MSDDELSMMIVNLRAVEAVPSLVEALEELQEFRASYVGKSLVTQVKEIEGLRVELGKATQRVNFLEGAANADKRALNMLRDKVQNARLVLEGARGW